jgi:hypothetical protein
MGAGVVTALAGLVAFFIGSVALVIYLRRQASASPELCRRSKRRALVAGGVLLANFPIAAIYAMSTIDVQTRYVVRIVNESQQTLDGIVLVGPGIRVDVGVLEPGKAAHRNLHFRGDGSLTIVAMQNGVEVSGLVSGYVTSNLGGEATIRLKDHGTFEVHHDTRGGT